MYEIELTHSIDMGHRIPGHEGGTGKCARLHGHTYTWTVKLCGEVLDPATGFLVDFGAIKGLLNEWDHRTLLWDGDPLCLSMHEVHGSLADGTASGSYLEGDEVDEPMGIIRVPFVPTAEELAYDVAQRLLALGGVTFVEVVCHESPKSAARIVLPRLSFDMWPAAVAGSGDVAFLPPPRDERDRI